MTFYDLAKERYSERFFSSENVSQEKLDRIIDVGRFAPTACNYQPQRFFIIRNKESMEKLKLVTPFHYNAPVFILVCYDINTAWTNPSDNYYKNYNSGEQDATISATQMMYEALELGVHSIWVRGFDSKRVALEFNLDKNIIPVMLLGLGYPNDKSKPSAWHYKRNSRDSFVKEL
ncbi:MAG: nitroreductase family protein [Bacilli bacterium]|nr:nitroreductase family protein [Bacilli bacterium]